MAKKSLRLKNQLLRFVMTASYTLRIFYAF